MNPDLNLLQPYPFEKLNQLKAGITPKTNAAHIALSIGEPKHSPPAFVLEKLAAELGRVSNYAATKGLTELRESISSWACQRFQLKALDAQTAILPVNGTREAIFAFTQACIDRSASSAKVLMPNPFYQIYEGAAKLAGAEPVFLNCLEQNAFIPDFDSIDEKTWRDCQLLFLCSPGNPTGAVLSSDTLKKLIALADKYDFIIASDECYSELYFDENKAPTGLLQACAELGRDDYQRCVVFHSLSKRSNLPGLRSGFIAGDSELIQQFLLYRTYHGCAMPVHTQLASIAAWNDEKHVLANRELYRQKFAAVCQTLNGVLEVKQPPASFYLWPKTPIDEQEFARRLYQEQNVTVLPGSYLARQADGLNPGCGYVRMALVATLEECIDAAERICQFTRSL
ncbi:succinyldiaminopimelate transaminase [Agaribacterium haliotis]|uniref:succinyldiaminopimelate transaminase n=1 Tax=Agaribacterium haliotis TaxID=2013869 RepID=UPI000BB57193|nr:succinyldiaminopimelate transaminase [Agaribacterium haliotis]